MLKLQRVFTPDDMGWQKCELCVLPFEAQSVIVVADQVRDPWGDAGTICPGCLDFLGKRNHAREPSVEVYEAACKRYPEPIFDSEEEADRELDADDNVVDAKLSAANWIIRC